MDDNKPLRKDGPNAAGNKLQKLSGDSIASQKAIAVQVHLTALNSKSESDAGLAQEFLRSFWAEPPEAVEWAFRSWRDASPFFPAISEIRALVDRWHREKREAAEAEKRRAEREAIDQARREGKLVDFADLRKELANTLAAQPEPEHTKKQREFQHRMQRAALAVGTLHLSEEEIRARRERERKEIRRYQDELA